MKGERKMAKKENNRPKIGIAIIILKNEEVLLGKRNGAHGAGTWSFPGGKLDIWENLKDCAKRETREETGLEVELIDENPIAITNDMFFKDEKHYVTLYFRARYISGEPRIMEPEKCGEWKWFKWGYFPNNLFLCVDNLIKTGYNPLK